jgi:hypothetical protein
VVSLLPISGGMGMAKPFDAFSANFNPGLAKKLVGEQASAHANLAMDAPHRQFDALCIKRLLPGKDVLIDAVHECAIEIKQEDRFDTHAISPVQELRCHQRRRVCANSPTPAPR